MNSYSTSLLLIYRPREDERLSWPCWLIYSGRFTQINGYPSAAGQVQTSESSPVRDRRSTTELPNQLKWAMWHGVSWRDGFHDVYHSTSIYTQSVLQLQLVCWCVVVVWDMTGFYFLVCSSSCGCFMPDISDVSIVTDWTGRAVVTSTCHVGCLALGIFYCISCAFWVCFWFVLLIVNIIERWVLQSSWLCVQPAIDAAAVERKGLLCQ